MVVDGWVGDRAEDRHWDRLRRRLRAHPPEYLAAVDAGHHQVQDDRVGDCDVEEAERRLAAVHDVHLMSVVLQEASEGPGGVFVVLDDEQSTHAWRSVRRDGRDSTPGAGSGDA